MICLFESSTCFEQLCAHPQEDNCINTTSGIITVLVAVFLLYIYVFLLYIYVFLLYIYVFLLYDCVSSLCLYMTTLTEIFPCFFLSCKANVRVKPTKTGHGPPSS